MLGVEIPGRFDMKGSRGRNAGTGPRNTNASEIPSLDQTKPAA